MIEHKYINGVFETSVTYAGRIHTLHSYDINVLPTYPHYALPYQVDYKALGVAYLDTRNDYDILALYSYKTLVAYILYDKYHFVSLPTIFIDFSAGYSSTTSKQVTMFKRWLERASKSIGIQYREYKVEDIVEGKRLVNNFAMDDIL